MQFIAIEGQDYVGKTTQIKLLEERLQASSCNVLRVRSPGGCPEAETLRELILKDTNLTPNLRNILAGLSRQLTSKVIAEFLEKDPQPNKIVLSDRWISSGYAYQVCGEGVYKALFTAANKDVLMPDLEIRLCMAPEERLLRKKSMKLAERDLMEQLDADASFSARVESYFQTPSVFSFPIRTLYIEHDTPTLDIHAQIWRIVSTVLPAVKT